MATKRDEFGTMTRFLGDLKRWANLLRKLLMSVRLEQTRFQGREVRVSCCDNDNNILVGTMTRFQGIETA